MSQTSIGAELCGVHSIVMTAVGACDEKPYRAWLIELGRMIERALDKHSSEQMLIDAQADAMAAEELRRAREGRKPENRGATPEGPTYAGGPM